MSDHEVARGPGAPGGQYSSVAGIAGPVCAALGLVIGILEAGAPHSTHPRQKFSIAGWQSGRMPRWLSTLGLVVSMVGVVSGVAVNPIVQRELLAAAALSTFGLLLPVWLVAISIMLLRDAGAARLAEGIVAAA